MSAPSRLSLIERTSCPRLIESTRLPVRYRPQAKWLNKILHGYLKYDLPLWLTEFACGDEPDKMTASKQASYLADALTLLELHPAVARYAW